MTHRREQRSRLRSLLVVGLLSGGAWSSAHAMSITVTTFDDELNSDGDCSLREAVASANLDLAVDACAAGDGADVIELDGGTYALTLTGSGDDANLTGDLDLADNVAFVGAGGMATVIDGILMDRVLHVVAPVEVVLTDLTIVNGSESGIVSGAGSDLTLIRCVVRGNRGRRGADDEAYPGTGGHGGGIYSGGTLTIEASLISDNQAGRGGDSLATVPLSNEGGRGGSGGGIYAVGPTVLLATVLRDNVAGTGGNGGYRGDGGRGGDGGGIGVWQQPLHVGSCELVGNTPGTGGLHWNGSLRGPGSGGGISQHEGTLSVVGTTFRGNGLGMNGDSGGAIYGVYVSPAIESSLFDGNLASYGGGVSLHADDEPVRFTNCTFSGNRALAGGGSHATVSSSTWAVNEVHMSQCTFADGSGDGVSIGGAMTGRLRGCIVDDVCSGAFASDGHNVVASSSGCPAGATGDRSVVMVGLGPLANNGGATLTHALLATSPALDAGVCADVRGEVVGFDQRGAPRPGGAACDSGAYEQNAPSGVDLLRNVDWPMVSQAAIFAGSPVACPPLDPRVSLDPTGSNCIREVLPVDDDDSHVLGFVNGALEPELSIVAIRSKPVAFYQVDAVAGVGNGLRLVRVGTAVRVSF